MEVFEIGGIKVRTLYFGGGTPSLLDLDALEKILSTLSKNFNLSKLEEFTLEVNPETVEYEKFKQFKAFGINRISMGVQSFNDKTLKVLGRVHTARDVYTAFEILRRVGFENINLDLMFALPDEKLSDTMYSLQEGIRLNPEHISYYSLTIEEGTKFYENRELLNLPDEDLDYNEYVKGIELLLDNGFTHYEISNFSKIGYESKHNKQYWRNLPYLGFGVSAYSYFRRKRFGNFPEIDKYCKAVKKDASPTVYEEKLTGNRAKAEHIMLNLRLLKEGVDKSLYYKRFGTLPSSDFPEQIYKLRKCGFIEEHKDKILLTKRGMLLANDVFTEFLP